MQYQGGKSRIAKPISEVINALSRWQIESCKTDLRSNNEYGGAREREREREYSLVYSVVVARLKLK